MDLIKNLNQIMHTLELLECASADTPGGVDSAIHVAYEAVVHAIKLARLVNNECGS